MNLFSKIWSVFPLRKKRTEQPAASEPELFDGRNDRLIADEFRHRFMVDIFRRETRTMSGEAPLAKVIPACLVMMPLALVAGAAGGPIGAAAASVGIAIRAVQASFNISSLLQAAGAEVTQSICGTDIKEMERTNKWLEKNEGKLAGYLNTLDKYEEEYRRAAVLVRNINNRGNADAIREEDRLFLRGFLKYWRYRNDRLKAPINMPPKIPSSYFLSVTHQTGLSRLAWREISCRAGSEASVMGQTFKLLVGGRKQPLAPQN